MLFAQLIEFLPWTSLSCSVARYGGDLRMRSHSYAEQFRAMAFTQLILRENLHDIEAYPGAQPLSSITLEFALLYGAPRWPKPMRATTGTNVWSAA
jgi:hypothetical protein